MERQSLMVTSIVGASIVGAIAVQNIFSPLDLDIKAVSWLHSGL